MRRPSILSALSALVAPSAPGVPARAARAQATGNLARIWLCLLLGVIAAACADGGPLKAPGGPAENAGEAIVTHIVDGDTIDVDVNGRVERVRLIGVDTPESVAPDRPVQCYGAEASARTAELIPIGSAVRLERDEVSRDQFGRLLAYVWRDEDNLLVNLALIEEGYADAVTYGDNEALYDLFVAAEAGARADERGLWSTCGGPDVDIDPPAQSGG